MRGIKDLRDSFETYTEEVTMEEYQKTILLGCEALAEEIQGSGATKITINRIGSLNLRTNKLMHYIYKYMDSGKWERAKEGLKKLKNANRQVFRGLLSRIEHETTKRGDFIRRIRVLHQGDDDNHQSG